MKFICEYCEKRFDTMESCLLHELSHKLEQEEISAKKANSSGCSSDCSSDYKTQLLKDYPNSLCNFCDNAYYVYGCEFNCQYKNSCKRRDNYPFFERKE